MLKITAFVLLICLAFLFHFFFRGRGLRFLVAAARPLGVGVTVGDPPRVSRTRAATLSHLHPCWSPVEGHTGSTYVEFQIVGMSRSEGLGICRVGALQCSRSF